MEHEHIKFYNNSMSSSQTVMLGGTDLIPSLMANQELAKPRVEKTTLAKVAEIIDYLKGLQKTNSKVIHILFSSLHHLITDIFSFRPALLISNENLVLI
jgi:hypothetical protein